MLDNKRILIFSNNPISFSSSNGRTLRNYLHNVDSKCIHNFFIHGFDLDFTKCSDFYCVRDRDAIIPFKKHNGLINDKSFNNENNRTFSRNRNAFNMIIRFFLWNLSFWKNKEYKNWLNGIRPNIVLCQTGDSPFLDKEARKVAKRFKANYIVVNTEGFCLFNFNYLKDKKRHSFFSSCFQTILKKEAKKNIKFAVDTIYLNESLKQDYIQEFGYHNSEVIYNSSTQEFCEKILIPNKTFFYAGNFLHNRIDTIISLSKCLAKYPDYKIEICGDIDEIDLKKIKNINNIQYLGLLNYKNVLERSQQSLCNLCVEPLDNTPSLKYGFSTKISDLLSSNRPVLYFGCSNTFTSLYLSKTETGYVVFDEGSLDEVIQNLVKNNKNEFSSNQKLVLNKNHSLVKNSQLFSSILEKY